MSAVLTDARVAQRWSTTLPRWGSRVRSPSRASFFCVFLGTGIESPLRFGRRSTCPAGRTRATGTQRRSRVRSTLRSGRRKADVHWTSCGLRSAPVGAKRVPLARSTVSRFFFLRFLAVALCGSFFVERWRSSKLKTPLHDCRVV